MKSELQDYPLTNVHISLGDRGLPLTIIAEPDWFLERLSREDSEGRLYLPYWTYLWEASVGLARYIERLGERLTGQRVLEIGCGFGLTGIVACQNGAEVVFTDAEQAALRFARYNALQNGVAERAAFVQMDWNFPCLRGQYPYILASDVIYEEHHWQPIVRLLEEHLAPGGVALFSEPNRTNAIGFFDTVSDNGFIYQKSGYSVEFDGKTATVCLYAIQSNESRMASRPVQIAPRGW